MKSSFFTTVVVLCLCFSGLSNAAETDVLLEKAVETYGHERIHHPKQLFFKANDVLWLERPVEMRYFVELGDRALPMLSATPDDSEWGLEVKGLARFAIIQGWEGVGPFQWEHSGGMYMKYMNKVSPELRRLVSSSLFQVLQYSLSMNTQASFSIGADDGGASRDVELTIAKTSPSFLWIKTVAEILLVPAKHGSVPDDCLHIERNEDVPSSFDAPYAPIEYGQQIVIHYPVDATSAKLLSGVNRIMVPIYYRLEEDGPANVTLLTFHSHDGDNETLNDRGASGHVDE